MKKSVLHASLVVFLSALCVAAENDVPATHRQVVYHLTDSVIETVAADNAGLSAATVVVSMSEQPQNNYLKQQIIQSLVANTNGVSLHQNGIDTIIECNVRDLSLRYGEVFTETFFGERKVERSISLSLVVTILSASSGRILYSQTIKKASSDTVLYSQVDELLDDSLPFTMTVQPQLSFFDSIIEPVVVTVASGVVIYLFFTIRS